MGWKLPLLILITAIAVSGVAARPVPPNEFTNYGQYRRNDNYRQNASRYKAPAYDNYRNTNTYRSDDTYPSRNRDKGRAYDRDYGRYDSSVRYRYQDDYGRNDHFRNGPPFGEEYNEDYHHSTPAPEPSIVNITADIITANEIRIGQWILHDEFSNGKHYFVIRDSKTNADNRFAIQEGLGNQWTFSKDRSLALDRLIIGKWVIQEEFPEEDRKFLVFRDTCDPDTDNRFAIERGLGNVPTIDHNAILYTPGVYFQQRDWKTNNWVLQPESKIAFVMRDADAPPGADYRYAIYKGRYVDLPTPCC